MAATSCPKCPSTSFELKTNPSVKNCSHIIHFVQCASCGAAIGILSERHSVIMEAVAKKVGVR